jgi:hypothetical protein
MVADYIRNLLHANRGYLEDSGGLFVKFVRKSSAKWE